MANDVPIVSPDSQLGSVPADQYQQALSEGYQPPSQQHLAQLQQEEQFGTGAQQLQTGVEGALSAATLGLAGPIQQSLIERVDPAQAKRLHREEMIRAEVNPGSRMAGELAGLGASALVGAGAAPIMELAGAAAAAPLVGETVAARIGSQAAKMATENMVYQLGSETDKHFWENPDSIEAAALNVGLAGIIGAGTGGMLGGVKELWKLGPGKKLQAGLEMLKQGVDTGASIPNPSGVELAPEISAVLGDNPAAQKAAQSLMDSGTKSGEALQAAVKQTKQNINEAIPSVLGQPFEDISKFETGGALKESLTKELQKVVEPITTKFEEFENKFGKQALSVEDREALGQMMVDQMAASGAHKMPSSATAALYRRVTDELPLQETLEDVRKYMSNLAQEHAYGKETYFAAKQIRGALGEAFDDILSKKVKVNAPQLLEDFAATKAEYGKFKGLLEDLNDRLHLGRTATGGIKGFMTALAEAKPEQILKRLNLAEDAGLQKLLNEQFPEIANLKRQSDMADLMKRSMEASGERVDVNKLLKNVDKMEPEYKNYLLNQETQQKLDSLRSILDRLPEAQNTSRTAPKMEKILKDMFPGAVGAISAAFGHSGLMGFLLGHVGSGLTREAPDAAKLAFLKFLGSGQAANASGFKAALDIAQATLKGETKLQQAVSGIFKGSMPAVTSMSLQDQEKLQKRIDALVQKPQDALAIGGDAGHYMPDHASALATSSVRVVSYLQSIKPPAQSSGLLGHELKTNAVAEANYKNAMSIAQDPAIILHRVKDGTLSMQDIKHLQSMYPSLAQRMQQKLSEELIQVKASGMAVPYKTQLSLSLFLGQPMTNSITPQAIQAAQPQQAPMPPALQRMPSIKPNSFKNMPKIEMTGPQARESYRTTGHR